MEKLKIYHVETQEDYDDLMIELEKQGYLWISGDKPTAKNCWLECQEETVICLNEVIDREMRFSSLGYTKREYPEIPIIKHKAEGVNRMGKVVVPQFVADWYERNKKGYSLYGLLHSFAEDYYLLPGLQEWVKDYNLKENDAQDILAKMYLFQDYEIEVEEEKKYYWRKKKECFLEFETVTFAYLNHGYITESLFFGNSVQNENYKTKFTETKLRELVSEEDFNKLERVEKDDV